LGFGVFLEKYPYPFYGENTPLTVWRKNPTPFRQRLNLLGRAIHPSSVLDRTDWLHGVEFHTFRDRTQWRREFGFARLVAEYGTTDKRATHGNELALRILVL
jgi:hypothetical protein